MIENWAVDTMTPPTVILQNNILTTKQAYPSSISACINAQTTNLQMENGNGNGNAREESVDAKGERGGGVERETRRRAERRI